MKRNVLLISFIAAFALFAMSFAAADQIAYPSTFNVEFNGVDLDRDVNVAGVVGDTVPVRVEFKASADVTDVRVKVSMEGHRDDISASTKRFDVVKDSVYTKLLSLELPEDEKDLTREYTLFVEVVSANDKTGKRYMIKMQRDSYTLEILSVDYSSKVSAGDVFPVSVVLKNNGYNRADDNYVVVSIPELGISTRGYAGDLVPVEDKDDDDEEDSAEEVVYLKVPSHADAGVYEMEVEVYNDDSSTKVTKLISVDDSGSLNVIAPVKNKDVRAGETVTFDLIVVNAADDVRAFSIETVSGTDLSVSAPTVVTVGPDSSETVTVTVTADDDADDGTYTFSVDVEGKQVVLSATVSEKEFSAGVVVLTIVLVLIFVALLAVLIGLLTRKEKTIEEVETSYY